MALGDVTYDGDWVSIEVLASRTSTNGTPSASATAGVSMQTILDAFDYNARGMPSDLSFICVSTAGSATMTVTLKAWMRFGTLAGLTNGAWCPSVLNGGSAIAEADTDMLRFAEPFSLSGHADRFYTEVTAIGGTNTAVTCFLRGRRGYGSGRL